MACLPCVDAFVDADHSHIETNTDHGHESDHDDLCTPFCVCACCGIFFTVSDLEMDTGLLIISQYAYTLHYSFDYSNEFFKPVWHPPVIK
jgi:hypothetical protein